MSHLSTITSIEVKTSQFAAEHYVQVKRHGEYDRWINVNAKSWNKIKLVQDDIDQTLADRNEEAFELYKTRKGSQKVVVSWYNGEPYVGIHLFDKAGERMRGKGLNLTMSEWQKLKEYMNDIDVAMASQLFPSTWEYPECKRPIFKDMIKTFLGVLKCEGPWSFTRPEIQKPERSTYFMIQERDIILPKAADLLVMCYTYLVLKSVRSLIQCAGCSYDHLSQVRHLDGCMMSEEEAMTHHGDQARSNTSVDDVLNLYKKVREELDLPPPEGLFDANSYLKMATMNTEQDSIYVKLFDDCML